MADAKHIIRTSDRGQFKRCRTMWNWGSKIRDNLQPLVVPKPLEFGTAIHAALETYYRPETWTMDREVVEALAIKAFLDNTNEQKSHYVKMRDEGMDVELEEDFNERVELGPAMLRNYFQWARPRDNFTPLYVELEFEVPILVPDHIGLGHPHFEMTDERHLLYKDVPVVYQGRIDMVLQDHNGAYWLWDHKTAAQFNDTSFLTLDEQCLSYHWALQQMLGIPVAGVIYNELRKTAPHPPKELVSGGLSKNKQQDTTYELYMQAIAEGGHRMSDYEDILEHFKYAPKQFCRRTIVPHNQNELRIASERIFFEALDMLGDPLIYPNPNRFNCLGCSFRQPCVAKQEGGDHQFLLDELYRVRPQSEEEPSAPTPTNPSTPGRVLGIYE